MEDGCIYCLNWNEVDLILGERDIYTRLEDNISVVLSLFQP